jgi:hypothetical protein
MSSIGSWLRTSLALGIPNLLRVAAYRIGVRTGLHPVCRIRGEAPKGAFFAPPIMQPSKDAVARADWRECGLLFGHLAVTVCDGPPDWMRSPLTGQRSPHAGLPWWKIGDFDPAIGDIKPLWELSRFDWLLAMAQRACVDDGSELRRLEEWLGDWARANPPYLGPNWKCGQEASIRLLHLAAAAWVLGQVTSSSTSLLDLVRLHLRRIEPTLQYALAQDNNHGTSEAAALFVGGSWLAAIGDQEGGRWMLMGRKWLETHAARLIATDGTFSQYSLNYHRLMLETMSFAEFWRRSLDQPPFSKRWTERCCAATGWLCDAIDIGTGDGPNVGANDGAHILRWSDAPYRDYRSTLQLASVLFEGRCAIKETGNWDQPLHWLGLGKPQEAAKGPQDRVASANGFIFLRRGRASVMLRLPKFRFRPAQADLLHLDLSVGAHNVLRDAGSFSYNTEASLMTYFMGAAGHNTVQFDDRDPMPRLGRFLFGNWPEATIIEPFSFDVSRTRIAVGYSDHYGARHERTVELQQDRLLVTDTLSGFSKDAVLRWRLMNGNWSFHPDTSVASLRLEDECIDLRVEAAEPWKSCLLVTGWESRQYLEKSSLPVLEIRMGLPSRLLSELRWKP